MRFLAVMSGIAAAALVLALNADAHLVRVADHPKRSVLENRAASQRENQRHALYVAKHGAGDNQRWHKHALVWIRAELAETLEQLRLRQRPERITSTGDACLDEIIDRETVGTWDHTIYNYGGSGAYGLPQALPGHKMSSAGADWRTNPWTQVRWMRGYVNGRYGGSCAALAFHNRNGWY